MGTKNRKSKRASKPTPTPGSKPTPTQDSLQSGKPSKPKKTYVGKRIERKPFLFLSLPLLVPLLTLASVYIFPFSDLGVGLGVMFVLGGGFLIIPLAIVYLVKLISRRIKDAGQNGDAVLLLILSPATLTLLTPLVAFIADQTSGSDVISDRVWEIGSILFSISFIIIAILYVVALLLPTKMVEVEPEFKALGTTYTKPEDSYLSQAMTNNLFSFKGSTTVHDFRSVLFYFFIAIVSVLASLYPLIVARSGPYLFVPETTILLADLLMLVPFLYLAWAFTAVVSTLSRRITNSSHS